MSFRVPFVNVPEHYSQLKSEILGAIDNILSKGELILKKEVEDFEKNLASFVGVKYAIGLNSGTDALFLALKAAGIGPGDEVITVAHTFVASVAVIVNCGAKPILVDVGEDFTMDVDKIEPLINKKTKAIIPVHLNGRVCDMEKLMALAKKYNLVIIEDAAQALGAKFDGKIAGSFGLAGCFSFYPFKILGAFGDAGAITTNDQNIADKIRLLRDHGQKTKTEIVCYGWNSRLDNLQAAILNIKFKYLPKWIDRRREIADLYYKGLSGIQEVKLPPKSDGRYFDIYQNYVLRVQKRDELFDFLKEKGVETLIKDPIPLHHQLALGLSNFSLPYTEQLAKEVISLPMYPELKDKEAKYVIDCIKKFYSI
jgi:dTDP-4-amino-4,6-dideoxygalactose transaminase